MNPVALYLEGGLSAWRKKAKVYLLKADNISVARIVIPGQEASKKAVIIASGMHLEETSGPLLLLDPKSLLPTLEPLSKRGVNFYIYPVINNYGLKFSTSAPEKFLRNNEKGINYNDGWGIETLQKCLEVKLVEKDIKKIFNRERVLLALSLHEDSTSVGKGYIWTNAVNYNLRKSIRDKIIANVDKRLLVNMREKTVQQGKVESGFVIAGAKGKGSFEDWLGEDLGIPTVLSEAPFGSGLSVRKKFHLAVISACLSSID